jgi:pimeloyl-ACP methyl ester carboxylesterase
MLGIASAPDLTEDLITNRLTEEQKATMERDGVVPVHSPYDPEPTPVTKLIIDEGRDHLLLRDEIPLDCPVRLIHGMKDPDVPWRTSVRLAEKLRSKKVEIALVKESEHRMSEPEDLERICETLDSLLRGL